MYVTAPVETAAAVIITLEDDALILSALSSTLALNAGMHPSLVGATALAAFNSEPEAAMLELFTGNSSDSTSMLYQAEHDTAGFITSLYEHALGRAPEAGAIQWYESMIIANGQNGIGMAIVGIATSGEAYQHAHAVGWLPA